MYLIFLGVLVVLVFFLFRKKTSKKELKEIPKHWKAILEAEVLFYQKLSTANKTAFKTKMLSFLNKTNIEAVGFVLEEKDVVLVAASAIIPVFHFKNFSYSNLRTVLIYPDYFDKDLNIEGPNRNIAGLVGTGRFENQMILSRRALLHGFANKTDKGNTAIHEFVHLIDKLDGAVDGVPKILLENVCTIPWLKLVHEKMEAINNDTSDMRNYGGTNQQEFFAVAAEYFFERPKLLQRKHPDLYQMLEKCFVKNEA